MLSNKGNFYFLIFSVISIFLIIYTKPSVKNREDNEEKKALALLFGGNPSTKKPVKTKTKSLYETDFWSQGIKNTPIEEETKANEGEPEILEKVSEGNPINPQTGLPYTDEQMEQFDKLREKFPNNSLIPKRKNAEQIKEEEEKQRRILEIQSKISVKKANKEEIEIYYDYQKKPILDRLELLEYVLKELKEDLPEDLKSQYEQVLKMNKEQIKNIEEQKNIMLKSAIQ
ncbi:MAG: hypothetical protein ACK4UJ_08220 [Leptonema sp. (in: bacteria)]